MPASEDRGDEERPTIPFDGSATPRQLHLYVRAQLQLGFDRDQVEDDLIARGYEPAFVVSLVDRVRARPDVVPAAPDEGAAFRDLVPAGQSPAARYQGDPSIRRNLAWVAVLIGIGLGGLWPLWVGDFWLLWFTGSTATATITAKEEQTIGYVQRRFTSEEYPIVVTGFEYHFQDTHGRNVSGIVWLQWGSNFWKPGDQMTVIYNPADSEQTSKPASLSFYVENDTSWTVGNVAGLLAIAILGYGLLSLRRTRPSRKRAGK